MTKNNTAFIKSIVKFLLILLFEMACGLILVFTYWLVSGLVFDKDGFGRSRWNELIYYIVVLVPPFIFSWIKYSQFKEGADNRNSTLYLLAGFAYLIGGLFYMLITTDFYLLGH